MKRKKILVHGTLESLQNFFSDAVSRDFDVVGILSDEPEKISIANLEVLATKNLPVFVQKTIDAIIFTGADKSSADYFLQRGIAPHKIILWDAQQGWNFFGGQDDDGTQVIFFCGLEFHIRNDDDAGFFNGIHWRLQTQRQIKNLNPQFYPAVLSQDYQRRMG